jgi:hypothetical protein
MPFLFVSMAPQPSPLEVASHSGHSFRSNKGRSNSGPSGGMSRGVQGSVRGIGGFFWQGSEAPTSGGVDDLQGGGCLTRRRLTLEASTVGT